jgi:CRISPR-associated protein (TIGR02584 family)
MLSILLLLGHMENETTQTILISLVGATPAVLTETVWSLATKADPIIPDRIIALSTAPGARLLKEKLFINGHWERMLAELKSRGVPLDGKLKFGPIADSIRVFPDLSRARELDDIRSLEDNQAVAEFFMEIIRSFTENDSTRLIVSIAGGRKTTSALLHSVMTLLGRAQDQINHILINDEWIYQKDFLYPGCKGKFIDRETGKALSSADALLELVDVPFVPLRYLFARDLERSAGSYVELMNQLRTRTINVDDDLLIQMDTLRGSLSVTGRDISLSSNEFLLYLFFAIRAKEGNPPVESYACIEEDLLDLKAEHLLPDNFGHWSQQALSSRLDAGEDLRKWASNIRSKLKRADFEPFQIDRLVPRGGHLAIDLPPEKIQIDA